MKFSNPCKISKLLLLNIQYETVFSVYQANLIAYCLVPKHTGRFLDLSYIKNVIRSPNHSRNQFFITDFKQETRLSSPYFAKQYSFINNVDKISSNLQNKIIVKFAFSDKDIEKIIQNLNYKISDTLSVRPTEITYEALLEIDCFPSEWKEHMLFLFINNPVLGHATRVLISYSILSN